nr:phosphopantetheine-binding protein [Pseudomonas sp. PGPR40]
MSGFMNNGLERQVVQVLSGCLLVDRRTIETDSRLVEDLHVDSVDVVEIVMSLNEAFGIDLPNAEVTEWRTVGDICCLVSVCKGG